MPGISEGGSHGQQAYNDSQASTSLWHASWQVGPQDQSEKCQSKANWVSKAQRADPRVCLRLHDPDPEEPGSSGRSGY